MTSAGEVESTSGDGMPTLSGTDVPLRRKRRNRYPRPFVPPMVGSALTRGLWVMQKRITPPRSRHIATSSALVLFVIALLTGSIHLIALGALGALILFPV
jgi:hypothetical protein